MSIRDKSHACSASRVLSRDVVRRVPIGQASSGIQTGREPDVHKTVESGSDYCDDDAVRICAGWGYCDAVAVVDDSHRVFLLVEWFGFTPIENAIKMPAYHIDSLEFIISVYPSLYQIHTLIRVIVTRLL